MVKTSQLKQLKSALSSAGLSRNSQPQKHKKKKSGEGTAIEKAKKAAKLEAIQRRLNPFDERVTRVKHDVGGRKLKGVVGKPAVSRQAGLEQVRSLSTCSQNLHVNVYLWFSARKRFSSSTTKRIVLEE
jgi:nucleolar protein 14